MRSLELDLEIPPATFVPSQSLYIHNHPLGEFSSILVTLAGVRFDLISKIAFDVSIFISIFIRYLFRYLFRYLRHKSFPRDDKMKEFFWTKTSSCPSDMFKKQVDKTCRKQREKQTGCGKRYFSMEYVQGET
jgi:hypothetical protein